MNSNELKSSIGRPDLQLEPQQLDDPSGRRSPACLLSSGNTSPFSAREEAIFSLNWPSIPVQAERGQGRPSHYAPPSAPLSASPGLGEGGARGSRLTPGRRSSLSFTNPPAEGLDPGDPSSLADSEGSGNVHARRRGFMITGQIWANAGDADWYFHPSRSLLQLRRRLTRGGIMGPSYSEQRDQLAARCP